MFQISDHHLSMFVTVEFSIRETFEDDEEASWISFLKWDKMLSACEVFQIWIRSLWWYGRVKYLKDVTHRRVDCAPALPARVRWPQVKGSSFQLYPEFSLYSVWQCVLLISWNMWPSPQLDALQWVDLLCVAGVTQPLAVNMADTHTIGWGNVHKQEERI